MLPAFLQNRPKTRKLPGQPKSSLRVGVTLNHDPEDPAEQLVSSSACSPASSPTEQLGLFDIIEDGVNNVNEKLKYLKNQENGSGTGVGHLTSQSHNLTETDSVQFKNKVESKQQEAILANHVEFSLSDMKDEVAVKELQERSQHGAEESGNFSQEVEKQRIYANGGSLYEGNGDFEAIRSVCSSQRSLQGIYQHGPFFILSPVAVEFQCFA